MKPTRLLALAAALFGSAVAYGVHLIGRQETAQPVSSAKPRSSALAERNRSSRTETPSSPARHPRSEARPAAKPLPAVAEARLRKIEGSPAFGGGKVLSEIQWRENAARVEMEANHELNRLTALLDLDSYQQENVFGALARNSPHWLPGMQAGGSVSAGESSTALAGANTGRASGNAGSVALKPVGPGGGSLVAGSTSANQVENADITSFLNPEQQQTVANDAADREEWWAEVLPQLLPPSVSGETTAVTGESVISSDATEAPATKEFDGGDVLIEE